MCRYIVMTLFSLQYLMLFGKTPISSCIWDIHTTDHSCYGQGGLWMGFNSPSHWRSFDSHRDALTPAQRESSLNNQRGWRTPTVVKCLNLFAAFLAGLCTPLEKRLLQLRAYPSTRILLHHPSNSAGQDPAAHPLLWRYRGTLVGKHWGNFI